MSFSRTSSFDEAERSVFARLNELSDDEGIDFRRKTHSDDESGVQEDNLEAYWQELPLFSCF